MASHLDYDVIVVGGGFAGVTAARDLAEQNYSVLLLEARDRLGGRTFTKTITLGGKEIAVDLGGQWIYPDKQVSLMTEIERYGCVVDASPPVQSYPTLVNGQHNPGPLPVPIEEIFALESAAFHLIRDARRITQGVPLDRQGVEDLDIPFSDYLDRLELPRATRGFLTYLSSFGMSRYPDEVTAVGCLNWIAQMDYSLLRTWAVLEEKIQGGTGALLDRMVADSRAEHRLTTPVRSVHQHADRVTVTTHSGEFISASQAVVATPLACWEDIAFDPPLNQHKRETSAEHHVARPLKMWAHVRNAPPFPFKIAEAESANGAWEMHTEYDLGEDGQIMVGFFIHEPDGARGFRNTFAGVQEFVATMFPGAELVSYEAHDWLTDEWAKNGDWVAWKPGRITKSHSHLSTPEGRLYFATADIAHTFTSWIDGAVEMGRKAATDVQRAITREAIAATVSARTGSGT